MNSLFILTNSPGEVSGWLAPVAQEIMRIGGIDITAVTLPCPYASGREKEIALAMPEVKRAINMRDALTFNKDKDKKVVLQLGGDPMHGFAISLRLSAPWLIYTARPRWKKFVSHYFIPDRIALERFERAKINENKYSFAGNLMFDSIPMPDSSNIAQFRADFSIDKEIICFMCGSRPFEYERSIPFFTECAKLLHEKFPDWQAVFPIAPTVDDRRVRNVLECERIKYSATENIESIILPDNYSIPFIREKNYDAIKAASLAVAFPGTNNLQIAAIGTPLIMAAPLNFAEEVPLDGIAGLLPHESRFMKKIKRTIVLKLNAREKFLSLPNRLTGRQIVPELRELVTQHSLIDYITPYIMSSQKRAEIAESYKLLNIKRGAAKMIAWKTAQYFKD